MCSRIVTLATALAGALLVVCGIWQQRRARASAPDVRENPTHLASASARNCNVYNWVDYIEPVLFEKFTAETGIKVVYDTYDSNELKSQADGRQDRL